MFEHGCEKRLAETRELAAIKASGAAVHTLSNISVAQGHAPAGKGHHLSSILDVEVV